MIVLNKKDQKDPAKLRERRKYVIELLGRGFPDASPSSQEWTSPEFQDAHVRSLQQEVDEIDALLKKLERR